MLSEPDELQKLMKVPVMDALQAPLPQMLGTDLHDPSSAKGKGEPQPWRRGPGSHSCPAGVGRANAWGQGQAGLCKDSAPHREPAPQPCHAAGWWAA